MAILNLNSDNEIDTSKKALIAHLKADEASSKVPSKYTNFIDIFLPKLTEELLKYMGINNHAIELIDDQQPSYGLIYSLGLVELVTFKVYIENNLTNDFIRLCKSPAKRPIFFNKKPDGSLRLCLKYGGLNNLTIKHWYLLPLVGESLN